ncbi:hypothetical protein EK21DRAFT_22725, partial [Setomelanomma holmii]
PGQPHYFGTRTDYQNGRMIDNVCRCQTPDSHGDAWTIDFPCGYDKSGQLISWQEPMKRVLEHCGETTVNQD